MLYSTANRFIVKYINVKENDLTKQVKSVNKRHALEEPIQFTYVSREENNATSRHIVIKEPEFVKEKCIPNITRTCTSLYVYCDNSLYTDFDLGYNQYLISDRGTDNKMLPWVAKVYVEGHYRCTGILIDLSWVIISESCLWDTL